MVTVFFPFRTSATFSIGTRTSLTYSPISSVLRRFSMLSLTFCSWPARVWMTNHWLCMQSPFCLFNQFSTQNKSYHIGHHKIDADRERAQKRQGDHDHDGRTFQFVRGRPGTLLQLFAGLGDVGRKAQQVALAPEKRKRRADGRDPDAQFDVPVQSFFPAFRLGGGGGIRTPDGG